MFRSLIIMAKTVTKAVKKTVKKVTTKKVTNPQSIVCNECSGRGLLDADNLCVMCDGGGRVTS